MSNLVLSIKKRNRCFLFRDGKIIGYIAVSPSNTAPNCMVSFNLLPDVVVLRECILLKWYYSPHLVDERDILYPYYQIWLKYLQDEQEEYSNYDSSFLKNKRVENYDAV